ncbi:MAG: hypothetical protein LBH29_04210 [Elusimicrobiota bacterium]|nr:hypothetical protein [Elusimicrobiota bacterium]
MFKKLIFLALMIAFTPVFARADILNAADSPTSRVLEYSSYNLNFRFFSGGNMQAKIDFGIFQFLTLGFSCELDNFVGAEQIKTAMPALFIKMLIYSGDMKMPSVALGYDGQGYFSNSQYSADYEQDPRGVFLILGKELFFESFMINAGLNSNSFKGDGIRFFANGSLPVIQDYFILLSELDNIGGSKSMRINLGVRLRISSTVDADFIIRDCWADDMPGRIPNERVFKVSHTGRF